MRLALLLSAALLLPLVAQDPRDEGPRPPEPGQPAPAFRLNDQSGRAVRIGGEDERWRVVAFFPRAATPG